MSRRKHNNQKKKDIGAIHVIEMSSYTRPDVSEVAGQDWIEYGEDNDYYQYLINRYNGSATNNAAINGIVEMIYGKGIECYEEEESGVSDYIKKQFPKDDARRICHDFYNLGGAACQIIYSKAGNEIMPVVHMPVETLRAEKASNGVVKGYYYSPNWEEATRSGKNAPVRYPAFGYGNGKQMEILFIKPYRSGYFYYSPVSYQGGIQYAELEEEIANYHLSNIKNGLSPSMLINFNNGVPSEQDRKIVEDSVNTKFSGSANAGRSIIAFNDSKELAASIEPVILSDAAEQYQFLADEARNKIMVSHRIVSGMIVGIKEQTGLGNNAEELQTASTLMDNIVIRPYQTTILDAFERILDFNGHEGKELYFKTLQPLEFTDLTNAITEEEIEQQTGQKSSNSESVTEEDI
jgi:hypothetical protein